MIPPNDIPEGYEEVLTVPEYTFHCTNPDGSRFDYIIRNLRVIGKLQKE